MGLIVVVFVIFGIIGAFLVVCGLSGKGWIQRVTYIATGVTLLVMDVWWLHLTILLLKR